MNKKKNYMPILLNGKNLCFNNSIKQVMLKKYMWVFMENM